MNHRSGGERKTFLVERDAKNNGNQTKSRERVEEKWGAKGVRNCHLVHNEGYGSSLG